MATAKKASRKAPGKSAPRKKTSRKKSAPKKSAAKKKPAAKKKSAPKKASKKGAPKNKNKLGVKNSLVNNINARKKKGRSRPKSRSTVSKKSYKNMQNNWGKGKG
jgi:hypothetical protein